MTPLQAVGGILQCLWEAAVPIYPQDDVSLDDDRSWLQELDMDALYDAILSEVLDGLVLSESLFRYRG